MIFIAEPHLGQQSGSASYNAGTPHPQLFWRSGEQHAARFGDWKLVQTRTAPPMLFNLREDIGEQADRAAKEPEKLEELQMAYAAWNNQMMPAQWRRQDARTQRTTGDTNGTRRGGGIEERFKQFDRNGDDKLTSAELPRAELFRQMDRNGDGIVTLEEARTSYREGRPARRNRD